MDNKMGSDLSECFKMHRMNSEGLPLTAEDGVIYFLHRIPQSQHYVGVQHKEGETFIALVELSNHGDGQAQPVFIVPWKKPIGSASLNIALLVNESHRHQQTLRKEKIMYQEPPIVYPLEESLSTDYSETADF